MDEALALYEHTDGKLGVEGRHLTRMAWEAMATIEGARAWKAAQDAKVAEVRGELKGKTPGGR